MSVRLKKKKERRERKRGGKEKKKERKSDIKDKRNFQKATEFVWHLAIYC